MRNHASGLPEEELILKSQQELMELLELGLVELYLGDDFHKEGEALDREAARAAILNSIYWDWRSVPSPAAFYTATEKGEQEVTY